MLDKLGCSKVRVWLQFLLPLVLSVSVCAEDWPQLETWIIDESGELEHFDVIVAKPVPEFWAIAGRDSLSRQVVGMGSLVDDYFSGKGPQGVDDNDSYVRLRVANIYQEGGDVSVKNNIKIKVDLPQTKKRYKFVFDSNDDDDTESLQAQSQDRPGADQRVRDAGSTSSAAVRVVLNQWKSFDSDLDVGVRAPLPLNPFIRLRLGRIFQLNEFWHLNWRNSLYHYHQDGPGAQTRFDFGRPVGKNFFFNNMLRVKWDHDENELEYADVLSLTQRLTEKSNLYYSTGLYYFDEPKPALQSYFAEVKYRKLLYRDWLFGEITPSMNWHTDNDFKAIAAISFRLEIFFND